MLQFESYVKRLINETLEKDETLLQYADVIFEKYGIDVKQHVFLGQGHNGFAYDIGNGLVVKLTEDESEAKASNVLKGQRTQNVCRIHEVVYLTNDDRWLIFTENLSQLDRTNAKEIDVAVKKTLINSFSCKAKNWENTLADMMKYAENQSFAYKGFVQQYEEYVQTLKKYSIDKMIEEFSAAGIGYCDFKSSNIMMRGNEYVAIDLGASKITTESDIDSI